MPEITFAIQVPNWSAVFRFTSLIRFYFQGLISPVHDCYFIKKGKLVTSTVRAEMINLAIAEFNKTNNIGDSYLLCDQWEASQASWTRTIDVLKHFKEMIEFGFFNVS